MYLSATKTSVQQTLHLLLPEENTASVKEPVEKGLCSVDVPGLCDHNTNRIFPAILFKEECIYMCCVSFIITGQ